MEKLLRSGSLWLLGPVCLVIPLLASCVGPPAVVDLPTVEGPTLVAAGDVACPPGRPSTPNSCRMGDTAQLIGELSPNAVLVLGDAQYPSGSLEEFLASYHHSWGRFRPITSPVPGNHEYLTPGAAGYFAYFGRRAGTPEEPWYAFGLGDWRLYALNSNCSEVGGCDESSRQYRWLRTQLEADESACSLAFWHAPRFSSGYHGGSSSMREIWQLLDDHGVDLVLSGHDHHYERFAPMDAAGARTPAGIRQFIVGTGGSRHYPSWRRSAGSEAVHSGAFGVLQLTLANDSYAWTFVPVEGNRYRDAGTSACY